jgi:soluble lytic murein transglycosylase-like protein
MAISFAGLKLLAQKNHDIVFRYKRNSYTQAITKNYQNPTCHMADLEPLGEDIILKRISKKVRNALEAISSDEGVNPSLVAGLIAQESAFNPLAVSSAKAIGLTQVTELAGKHVLATYKDYPSYPNLNEHSVAMIKTLIITGKINSENEWRLNPQTSIQGGIHYLKFVENYWLNKRNRLLMLEHYKNENEILDDLILASYNSGPFRVKKALTKRGTNWLQSENLGEARKYVRKVKSYCYHFAANNSH